MPPGGGNLEGAFRPLLSLDRGQIGQIGGGVDHGAGGGAGQGAAAGEMRNHLGQRGGGMDGACAHPGRLRATGRRTEQRLFLCGSRNRGGQHTRHRHQTPVERQLAHGQTGGNILAREDAQFREKRQRNGQVEMRPLFRQIGRRKVDRQLFRRQRDGEGAKGCPDPLARLRHRFVGQADDAEPRQTGAAGTLHLDQTRIDPLKRHRIGLRHHAPPPPRDSTVAGTVAWIFGNHAFSATIAMKAGQTSGSAMVLSRQNGLQNPQTRPCISRKSVTGLPE